MSKICPEGNPGQEYDVIDRRMTFLGVRVAREHNFMSSHNGGLIPFVCPRHSRHGGEEEPVVDSIKGEAMMSYKICTKDYGRI